MKMIIHAAIAVALATAGNASAQEVSDSVKRSCRSFAESNARSIVSAIKAKRDPGASVRRVADNWLEGVQNHMLMAASRAEYLSEEELASIGYAYCVERRPTGR